MGERGEGRKEEKRKEETVREGGLEKERKGKRKIV